MNTKFISSLFASGTPSFETEFWRKIGTTAFEQMPADDAFRALIDQVHRLLGAAAYYLYLPSSGDTELVLEFMDLRFHSEIELQKELSVHPDIIDLLQTPEISLPMDNHYKTLGYATEWAGSFLILPLIEGRDTFRGCVLAGPLIKRVHGAALKSALQAFCAGATGVVTRIRAHAVLKEQASSAAARAHVTQKILGSALEVDRFVSLLLDLALTSTKTEAGFVAIARGTTLAVRASKNLSKEFLTELNLSSNGGLFEWSLDADDILILQDFDFVARHSVKSILAVPLVENRQLNGVFALINFTKRTSVDDTSLTILKNFCDQIRLVLNNSHVFEEFSNRYLSTLKALSESYDVRSAYGAGHSRRVADCALRLGKELSFGVDDLKRLETAALVHDVGMCGVVEAEAGFRADYHHPTVGSSLIEVLPIDPIITQAVATHHEWFDGWGYPNGLSGESIPLLGRVLAVAEHFDESQSGSLQKHLQHLPVFLDDLKTRRGLQFDPAVVDALMRILKK
ncbi:MAG TPA: HD domain-containing phosphohydrolase [Bacteroidota bacterium]|nr:HD domain-containing phosphohydrolase [Bacteroidota bacterium]